MEQNKSDLMARLVKACGILNGVGAYLSDNRQLSQADLIARVLKTVEETIIFLAEDKRN